MVFTFKRYEKASGPDIKYQQDLCPIAHGPVDKYIVAFINTL